MRAVWYDRNGDSSVLTYGELPTPSPGPGEVLVRLATSGANPSDWKTRRGSRPMAFPRVVPHSDGAGTIEAVGEGVDRARIGQRVWIWNGQWKRAFGTAAEYIALPSVQAVPLPGHVPFEAGACLGIPALTALHGVLTDGGVTGQAVLVTGGAGSVGHYAIQFARLLGAARIIATVSSEEKAAHALSAGADDTINYRTEDVAARIADLTRGQGVQRVVDVDLSTTAALLPTILAPGGICAAYGSNGPAATVQFGPSIIRGIAIRWFIVYELTGPQRSVAVDTLQAWLRADLVRHAIAARVPLAECAAAHDAVEGGKFIGNLVLDC
ncbi:NADPH:quinone reductase [Paracraurococcus lichenis]|uniref:NADPH:quinone reductase n=1 Tax=Paracraurococcus lichenis TaxID=3064888 RepID=A0ABT9E1K0_9PROT|nr:NADPH:quinone reductase [Paracraurococcus sp. LOR1-02]MDO9710034.1 NADPH:quinone reductase [Paracraurococcus sp. LOR1-02]